MVQVGPPPPWLEERKPEEWKPRDVANAVLIDRSAVPCHWTKSPLMLVPYDSTFSVVVRLGWNLHVLSS